MLKADGFKAIGKGWQGVSKLGALGGAVDIGTGWKRRGRRISRDGRRNKKWRKVRDRTLRPVLRTVASAHPVGFLLSKLLRI